MDKQDKIIEKERYEKRALELLAIDSSKESRIASELTPPVLREPYVAYEKAIRENIFSHHKVLEICAGTGMHTYALLQTGASVLASDISESSLKVLKNRLSFKNLKVKEADIESLPFADNNFDFVVCAGGLSYGNAKVVDAEILRVLKDGGGVIFVDSLNHNPIYRLNRWLHYRRNQRSKSTLVNMPTISRIKQMGTHFGIYNVQFFGLFSWLMKPLARLVGQNCAASISNFLDRLFRVKSYAFKFVMVAKNLKLKK
ncbi:MAG: Ubiquinone/menaquinone biosynthesis C-methyltransferase UbiE [Turneriella sp.]|nr:Ubiquinone/menaquinone biosynthesis C-methyltransferase UbiE [Turneriella sp.]